MKKIKIRTTNVFTTPAAQTFFESSEVWKKDHFTAVRSKAILKRSKVKKSYVRKKN